MTTASTRARAVSRILLTAAGALACSPTPNVLPSNDFNRPTDLTFMCLGAFDPSAPPGTSPDAGATGPRQVSGRPMAWCHPPGTGTGKLDPGPTVATRTFAFMPNSASGELSVIDVDHWKIVDLDPSTGGYGRAPLGRVPEQLSASTDGCRLVAANRGSCDLSLVDPAALLAPVFQSAYGGLETPLPEPRTALQTVVPRRGDGTFLRAAPYEVAFLPRDTNGMTGAENLCPTGGAQPARPWRVLVTYPSCDLVAMVELPSGNIISSVRVTADSPTGPFTFTDAGTSPSCASDCGAPAAPDAGAASDGGTDAGTTTDAGGDLDASDDAGNDAGAGAMAAAAAPATSARPSGIAIMPDGSRAFVSLSSASAVMTLAISDTGIKPNDPIALAGAGGSNRLRLGVDPYKLQIGGPTMFPGALVNGTAPDRGYLYVIAQDGSIHVVDVVHFPEAECDTNIDPMKLPIELPLHPGIKYTATSACIPVSPDNERPGSNGPGIRFPALPVDLAAVDIRPMDNASSEATVAGAHAWVLTSSGAVFLVNIDPVKRALKQVVLNPTSKKYELTDVVEAEPFANTKRDRNQMSFSAALDPSSGPPRVAIPPAISFTGPYLESFWTKGSRANAMSTDDELLPTPVYFRDPTAAVPQSWTVAWEGALITSRHGGQLVRGQSKLADGGGGFCTQGVLPGDTVTFNGCITDAQCVPGFKCHRDPAVTEAPGGLDVTGLCIDPAEEDLVADEPFQTLRRYEIVAASQSALTLAPRLDEIVYSELTPCDLRATPATGDGGVGDGGVDDGGTSDGGAPDGGAGDGGTGPTDAGSGDARAVGGLGPACGDMLDPTTSKFECVPSPRWTGPGPAPKRCLQPCATNDDCRRGRVCGTEKTGERYCVDAPPLEALEGLLDQVVTYSLNVGAGFLVSGGQTGVLAAGKEEGGACVPDETRDVRLVARIPVRTIYDAAGTPIGAIQQCPAQVRNDSNDNRTLTETANACATAAAPPACPANTRAGGTCVNSCLNDLGEVCVCGAGEAALTCTPFAERCWRDRFPLDKLSPTATFNPCLYIGGPAGSDPTPNPNAMPPVPAARHVRALFQNPQVTFVVANIDRSPPSGMEVRFDVSGGFRPQAVGYPSTVEVSMPARIVLGPVDSQPQVDNAPFEAPYLLVVDRRRLGRGQAGGPTRGQLVRIHPFFGGATVGSASGFQPIYEDYNRSGGLFPIQ